MTDAEKVDRLLAILERTGLGWIATQLREHIRTGRTMIRVEPVLKGEAVFIGDTHDIDEVDQLPPRASLEAVRDALSVVTVDLAAMEAEVNGFFSARVAGFQGIAFEAEPMDEAKPFRVAPPDPDREGHRENVRVALSKLVEPGGTTSGA